MRNFAPLVVSRWRSILSGMAALVILFGALVVAPMVADAQRGVSYTFVNRTRWTITHIYMSSSRDGSWRDDRLGSRVLPPGNSFTLRGLNPGRYDIKTRDEDGDECTRMGVPVFRSTTWVINTQPYLRCLGR